MKVGEERECYGIKFKKIDHIDYKYYLTRTYMIDTKFKGKEVHHKYFTLAKTGMLIIKKSYCWDGASGPTFDTDNTMRGSLVHDVFYQMCREKLLKRHYKNRKFADDLFYKILRKDGMFYFRAKYYWLAVRSVGWIFT